jgi:glycosyltransferase involved in cell wall biosynthesis
MRMYSRLVQSGIARVAQKIITVSEYSRQQISQRLGVDPEQIVVTHEAASSNYCVVDQDTAEQWVMWRYGVRNFVLSIASVAPRKNVQTLLQAYGNLAMSLRSRHPLVLVCTHPFAHTQTAKSVESWGLDHEVVFVEQPSDEELLFLYNAAALFVFPSLEEGFGLPPLEAMACATPVVSSNTSSMPEVLGDAALLVDPTDVSAISSAIAQVLTTPMLADELREKGLQRSRQFTWEKTAEKTLAVYRSLAVGDGS